MALMPRSLLVFSAEAYTDCLHGIDPVRPCCSNLLLRVLHGLYKA